MNTPKITPHLMKSPDGNEILSMRKLMCLTRDQAAALAHVSSSTWRQWESGQRIMGATYWDLFVTKATILQAVKQLKTIIFAHPSESIRFPVAELIDLSKLLRERVEDDADEQ